MLLAGIHLLISFACLLYLTLINNQNVIVALILLILTAPWGLLLMFLPSQFGISVPELASRDLFFIGEMGIGALINAFILYWLGFLLTKAFKHLTSKTNV
jgi:hypothetical protein